ncbi:UDP-3-O-acylglucosamine N-acyltransferase [Planctomycetes bacterium Poly30]|uniref:UDP-3-O-acylglucosamine N-acyltransferase n=1 Tax=Saltatorellus ferox TaxID=2528018 RepID=A0A518ERA7_9BACT|nr:UDP-3-O-acylglucosamine N-acyltransferase [Planctomycetes bacterium Poly30]
MSTIGGQKTVAELAELCGATVEGRGDLVITGPAGLRDATAGEISFLSQEKYAAQLGTTHASAVLVAPGQKVEREGLVLLRVENPEAAFTRVILAFAPEIPELRSGVSPLASIDESASVHPGARIAAHVCIGPGASVADGAVLHPGVIVSAHARVGEGSVLHPNVVLYPFCEVGARCILHAGAVIGADGFGFHPVPAGLPEKPLWQKTPQVGNAVIEDDCEIGANTTIDCARFGSTRIGRGCKVDNLVHVGHNVQVAENTLLLALAGIAGSSTIGKNVIIAGQAGITGHVHVGDGAIVMGGAGIIADVEPGAEMFGYPAGPRREKMRSLVSAEKAGKDVRALKKEIKELRSQLEGLIALQAPSGDSKA